jgi:hypothetical protein
MKPTGIRGASTSGRVPQQSLSDPEAVGFYEATGLKRETNCFSLNNLC